MKFSRAVLAESSKPSDSEFDVVVVVVVVDVVDDVDDITLKHF